MSATQITSVKPKQGTQPSFKSSPAPPPAASEHTGPEFLLTCWLSLCPQVAKATCIVATRVPQSTQHDEPSYAFAKMRWEDSCCRGQKQHPNGADLGIQAQIWVLQSISRNLKSAIEWNLRLGHWKNLKTNASHAVRNLQGSLPQREILLTISLLTKTQRSGSPKLCTRTSI